MLCKAPFIGMYWRGNRTNDKTYMGTWRSCCESMSNKYAWKAPNNSTFEEIYNNPIATEIRDAMEKDLWHPNCLVCKEKEDKFGESPRKQYNQIPNNDFIKLDYRPSNLCNLKCRMCNGLHSSLLATEEGSIKYLFDKKSKKDELPVDWSKLKEVKLLGGEPMIMEETIDVLEKLTEECQLVLTTNAYKISKDIEKSLINAKCKVHINLSIDGIKDTYNYIRVNSHWETVEENIIRLNSYGKFELSVNPVGMIWNAFVLNDLFQWCDNNQIHFGNVHWVGEKWNRIGLLSNEHKEQIKHPKINHLLNENFHNREELLTLWRNETNRLDKLRNTDIVDLDDRYVDYL